MSLEQKSNGSTATERKYCEDSMRQYSAIHIDEDLSAGLHGMHENALFYNCTFKNIRDLTLKDCVLTKSRFLTDKLEDAIGFTITLGDCHSFSDVEYSDFLFDLFLVMAIKSNSNTGRRKKLLELVGHDTVRELLREYAAIEKAR
jgi:hypothetical protein